jgi:hypothetical protein
MVTTSTVRTGGVIKNKKRKTNGIMSRGWLLMKSKKVFSRLLGLLIILAISFYSVYCLSAVNNSNTYMEDFSLQSKINKLETELNKIENNELKRISNKITTRIFLNLKKKKL